MSSGYTIRSRDDVDPRPDKPGTRWELSPELGVDAFNFNVAVVEPGGRLSRTHYHYHENQAELCYVARGRCRVEVHDGGHDLGAGDAVSFEAGEAGVHVVHNPYDEPCEIVAVGWPPEGRHPVELVRETDDLLRERYGEEGPTGEE
jgi:uncharacterized cupin superfamily protein